MGKVRARGKMLAGMLGVQVHVSGGEGMSSNCRDCLEIPGEPGVRGLSHRKNTERALPKSRVLGAVQVYKIADGLNIRGRHTVVFFW